MCVSSKTLKSNPMDLLSQCERKHSSGDLHSRLKTRKILGVGETDNGDIHRSKEEREELSRNRVISQLLGHNEHLYVKFPRGYWLWHFSMALSFTLLGINNLFFPWRGYNVILDDIKAQESVDSELCSRFYGCASLAIAFLLWSFWGTMDKGIARTLLLAAAFCHFLQVIAIALSYWENPWQWRLIFILIIRSLLVLPNAYFYRNIGLCGLRMRKSNSFNSLKDCASPGPDSFAKKSD